MIRKPALLGLAALSLVVICDPARAASVVFSDSTFDNANYTYTSYAGAAGYTTSISQDVGFGSDPALVSRYQKSGSTSPYRWFHALNSTFVYDPSVSGDITSIDVAFSQQMSLFHNASQVNLANAPAQVRVLAEQDGKLYLAARNVFTGLPFDAFTAVSGSGFLASEFTLFDTANPFAPRTLTGLDFSGGAITFGIELAHFGVTVNGGPSTGVVNSKIAIDNLRFTLNTQDAVGGVPEPGAWALMISGFGLAGTALRRSRRAAAAMA